MAYRKMEAQVPSFLDEFLDQIQTLPAQVKAKFAEMRELDDRAVALMSEAERNAADAVRKAGNKSNVGNDVLKKTFQDLLSCQGKATECASKKIELAENSYQLIAETIATLDEKLRDYEAQLKKEGRWPASNKSDTPQVRKTATVRTSGGAVGSAENPAVPATGGAGSVLNSGTVKSRKRDRETEKGSDKVGNQPSTTSVEPKIEAKGSAADAVHAQEDVDVVEDMEVDPDEPRYCLCNRISFGDMVACEGKNCAHEWFHYECVGLTSAPKGSWYCPECKSKRRKRS